MPDNPKVDISPPPEVLEKILAGTNVSTRLAQTVLALAGALGLLQTQWEKSPLLLALCITILCVGTAWFGIGLCLRRRKPKTAVVLAKPRSVSTYLRGLLPFEKGDYLLGREQETGQLLAMLRSLEFKFGFLSGEAGAGKTSLLRALIVPQLESDSRNPVYVPRAGQDPETAIRKCLQSVGAISPERQASALPALIASTLETGKNAAMLIIIDQFEEFFIANRAKEGRASFEKLLGEIAASDANICVLFALRKEFVDDLLDMGTTIPALQNARWRLPLRNFSSVTARQILHKIVEDENLRFSDDLQDIVIADLARDQRVRPVEFQLVLTTLLSQDVVDVKSYMAMQGAQGVIARFVAEVIEPPDIKISDREKWTARHVLRALCNNEFTTRRPVGLSRFELLDRLLAEASAVTQLSMSKAELENAIDHVVRRSLESYILIAEDEDRYNLAHDYLASPVRDATAGVETVEERATRLLERYVENARTDQIVLPWKTLQFIRRFARRESLLQSQAKALISRSVNRYRFLVGVTSAAVIAVVTVLLPLGPRYRTLEQTDIKGQVIVNNSGKVLVAYDRKRLAIYMLDAAAFTPLVISLDFEVEKAILSPKGDRVLIRARDKSLHEVRTLEDGKVRKLFDSMGWKDSYRADHAIGFSIDGTWSYAALADGRIYAWPANSDPQEVMRLQFLADNFERRVDLHQVKDGDVAPPELGMTKDGKHLWVLDGEGKLFIKDVRIRPIGAMNESLTVARSFGSNQYVYASHDGDWLAVSDASDEVRLINLSVDPPAKPIVAIRFASEGTGNKNAPSLSSQIKRSAFLTFSPRGQWLVARRFYDDFYVTKLDTKLGISQYPAVDISNASSDAYPFVTFDERETYVAGKAQDKKFYAWKLDIPPGTSATPVLAAEGSNLSATFCRDSMRLIVGVEGGSVYSAATLEKKVDVPRPIGWLASGQPRFQHLEDRVTLVAYDSGRLSIGRCGEDLQIALEQKSKILDVANDAQGNIVVIGQLEVTRIGKAFYFWGLPVWQVRLPNVIREGI